MSLIRSHILVCTGTGCTSSESPKIIAEFEKQLAAQGMDKEAQVVRTGCFGLCALGPIVTIYPEGACYTHVTVDDVEEIVAEHIVKGRIVKRLLNKNEGGDGPATSLAETRFYKHQHRIALRNCGVINPESIDEYIGVDGYAALGKILTEHIPPQQVIDTVLASGLRGRGGAGFPTGKKWQFTADAVSPDGVKYVCCNADEGDPGAFMDRSVLEGDPHTILEAMTIAGYAVGAHQGYIYVRAEYPIAVKRLETAIRQAKEYGLLGKNIFDSGFDFDLELRLGAGAFVCGEETALMRSIEGHRGEPKTRPPFPAVKGLFEVVRTGCFGLCALGPIVTIYPEGACYTHVTVDDVEEIVAEHIVKGRIVKRLLNKNEGGDGPATSLAETRFYKHQHRIALRNCGVINPESIDEYIGVDGYAALGKILTEHIPPQQVIDTVLASGLRGRGGAGFPTGKKWQFTADAVSPDGVKYVCCNADEGDPGAFMDRSVLEGDPHTILEAMTIAGYAVGAHQGYIYVRAEYPIAVKRLETAIRQAKEYGLLGKNIFDSGFDFDLELRLGAGAFVCGEETALMRSIEGHRGEPKTRPPFPAVKGLFDRPTLLNNVETYANITWIFNHGPEAYAAIGTETSKGTKVFALGGKITNTGLVEVPMGTTLRTVVEDIGGGVPGGKKFKAAQTGGPSGGCIPASLIDTPIDYESLSAIGSMMGSGGLIVMDEDNCMVDIAKFYLEFIVDESCGKCSPCRIGTKRLLDLLTKITEGNGEPEDLDTIEELCHHIKQSALCGLGQTAPNPVLSTLTHFREEFEAHIYEKRCPAGVCKALIQYIVDPTKCKGCTRCAQGCPTGAISGAVRAPHIINQSKCIKCGACMDHCRFDAIYKQ